MKIRSGFVSNSSSSSFVFIFDKDQKIPSTEDEVREFLSVNPMLKENKLFKYEYSDDLITIENIVRYILSAFENPYKCICQDSTLEIGDVKDNWDLYYNSFYCVFERYFYKMVYWETEKIRRNKNDGRSFGIREETIEAESPILKKLGFPDLDIDAIKKAAQLSYDAAILNDKFLETSDTLLQRLCSEEGITIQEFYNNESTNKLSKKIKNKCDIDPEVIKLREESSKSSEKSYVATKKLAKEMVDNFFKQNPTKKLVSIECSDNDPAPGSYCEHGDVFKYHQCLIVSNH